MVKYNGKARPSLAFQTWVGVQILPIFGKASYGNNPNVPVHSASIHAYVFTYAGRHKLVCLP
jgi:hypothetical protein